MRRFQRGLSWLFAICVIPALVGELHADAEAEEAIKALRKWNKVSVTLMEFPGCTNPIIESVSFDAVDGTIKHFYLGPAPDADEETSSAQVEISNEFKKAISEKLRKYYELAVKEKSVPERLKELEEDPEAARKLLMKNPPGIGGYQKKLLTISIETPMKKFYLKEEFSAEMGGTALTLSKWLKGIKKTYMPPKKDR